MGINALWTAAHHDVPLLIVVANNRAYYNDIVHQETAARERDRPVENKWVGQRLDQPLVDIAAMARALTTSMTVGLGFLILVVALQAMLG